MDIYYEQSLTRQNTPGRSAVYALCWALIAVLMLLAMFFGAGVLGSDPQSIEINWGSAVGLVLCLAATAILFIRKDHLRTEYDYMLSGDVLRIHAVLNRRRRKPLAELDLKRVLSAGEISSKQSDLIKMHPGTKVHDYRTEPGGQYLYYQEANVRRMLLLNPDERMAALIQSRLNAGVRQNIEGK